MNAVGYCFCDTLTHTHSCTHIHTLDSQPASTTSVSYNNPTVSPWGLRRHIYNRIDGPIYIYRAGWKTLTCARGFSSVCAPVPKSVHVFPISFISCSAKWKLWGVSSGSTDRPICFIGCFDRDPQVMSPLGPEGPWRLSPGRKITCTHQFADTLREAASCREELVVLAAGARICLH